MQIYISKNLVEKEINSFLESFKKFENFNERRDEQLQEMKKEFDKLKKQVNVGL